VWPQEPVEQTFESAKLRTTELFMSRELLDVKSHMVKALPKTWRLFDTRRDILRAQRATKLRRAAAPSGAAGAAWRRAAPP
jgi:hypothetical protein